MKFPTYLLVTFILSSAASATVASETAANSAEAKNFVKLMNAERTLNVGKVLPPGILVADRDGKQVDLRSAMHGPVTLLKLNPGCPPCTDVFKYADSHAKEKQGASIAVLVVEDKGSKPYTSADGGLGVYTTASKLDDSFLAGEITPSVFFFDKNLRLVERRAGLTTPETMLRFPTSP